MALSLFHRRLVHTQCFLSLRLEFLDTQSIDRHEMPGIARQYQKTVFERCRGYQSIAQTQAIA